MESAPLVDDPEIGELFRRLIEKALAVSDETRLLFVTNVRSDAVPTDLGPTGVNNSVQFYSQREADEIVRSFRSLGLTVEPFFSEVDLIDNLRSDRARDPRARIVYTTAEAGTGSGRRALIPALCRLLDVPIMNCGAHAATLVRHKYHAYCVLVEAGVRIPRTWQYKASGWESERGPADGLRVIVKPVYESMGIGVTDESVRIVDSEFEGFVADRVERFGQPAIVQEFVTGEEVAVPVARVGEKTVALPPISQLRSSGDPYWSEPKTFRDEHVVRDLSHAPYRASSVQVTAMRRAAAAAFDALEMKGVGRIDFRVDADGRAWVFDTNGEPPPLPKTSWSAAMEMLGFEMSDLLALWLGIGLLEHRLIS